MNIFELRKIRIANDYQKMCKLSNYPFISWKALKGEAPYVEEYLVMVTVNSFITPDTISNKHTVKISLPPQYPQSAPLFTMEDPVIYHPNWYENGRWGSMYYKMTYSLADMIMHMIEDIQFNPRYVYTHSCSNAAASHWYMNNPSLFPTDNKHVN